MLCLVCCACRQLLDSHGRRCLGTSDVSVYVLSLLVYDRRDRRTEGWVYGLESAGLVVGPLVTERYW